MFHLCGQLQQDVMMDFLKDATADVSCSKFQHWTSIVLCICITFASVITLQVTFARGGDHLGVTSEMSRCLSLCDTSPLTHVLHIHTQAIFICSSERKQITVHYHRLHAHKSVCTQRCLDYFGKRRVYYFVLWGREEEARGGVCVWGGCFAVLPVIRRLCLCACEKGSTSKINTSSA